MITIVIGAIILLLLFMTIQNKNQCSINYFLIIGVILGVYIILKKNKVIESMAETNIIKSKISSEKRVKNPENVLNIGDKIKVHVDSIENGKVSLSLLEDLDIPEESIDTGGGNRGNRGNRDSRPRRNDRSRRGNRDSKQSNDSSKRKRVSFEDEFEKGI